MNQALVQETIGNMICSEELRIRRYIQEYCDLMHIYTMYKTNVGRVSYIDTAFEKFFSSYYGLDATKMSYKVKDRFYACFKDAMNGDPKDLSAVIKAIDEDVVYFSFATKMLATINPNTPIYDSWVNTALGLGTVDGNDYFERLERALSIYRKLDNFYHGYVNQELDDFKTICVNEFELQYSAVDYRISDEKKIDFILWGMGKTGKSLKDFDVHL